MARILIRNDDREILFFTLKSSFSDIDPRVVAISAKYPGNTTFLTISNAAHVPTNLQIGSYLDSTNSIVSERPSGSLLVALDRQEQLIAKLDEHQEMVRAGSLTGVPADLASPWYKYLRMMTQASLQPAIFSDDVQWALVEDSMEHTPYDFADYGSSGLSVYDSVFADGGEYALGWWNLDRNQRVFKSHTPGDNRTNPSSTDFDYRYASIVALIPESEIDRTDPASLPAVQPWTRFSEVVTQINRRFPWYVSNRDATLRG